MLKTLLKKQMAEIFRAYLYDAKKNRKRSKASVLLLFLMYVLIMVGVLGGLFTYLSLMLCGTFVQAGIGWLYYVLMGLIAVALGAFGSVFNTYAGLYLSKDNDLLLSMPIPIRHLLASRLMSVYLMGLMYAAVVIVPAVIVYWITAGLTPAALMGGVVFTLLISLIVLILSCVLGWVVAKISLKLKNKSLITVVVSLVFIAAYYFLYFQAQSLLQSLLLNAVVYGEKIKGNAYLLYLFGCVGEGSVPAVLLWSAVVVLLCAAMWLVLLRSFIGIATASGKTGKTVYREKTARERSVFGAMLFKEFKRFAASPNYILNCGLGTLFLPLCGVLLLWKGKSVILVMDQMFETMPGAAAVCCSAALCMVASMNDTAAPSVSLEGKNLWIAQSLPVDPWKPLRAKLYVQLLLTGIPMLFCAGCLAAVLSCGAVTLLTALLLPLLYTLLSALFGLFLGLKLPNLTWTNELAPIKQGISPMLALFGGWGYAALLAGGYLLGGYRIGAACYMGLAAVLTGALAALLYGWLRKRGTEIFAEL